MEQPLRIAVLGAGFPGLIVADALDYAGHSIDVFGRPEKAGVLSNMGPRHLWDGDELRSSRAHPSLADAPRESVAVRWLHGGTLAAVDGNDADAAERFYAGYWWKSRRRRTGNPPCRGVREFSIVSGGFQILAKALDADRFEPIVQPAVELKPVGDGRWTVVCDGAAKHGPYDRVASTLSPQKFETLLPQFYAGRPQMPRASKVCYLWDSRPAMMDPGLLRAHDGQQVLVYSGDPLVWWHRLSTTGHNLGWCHEAHPDSVPSSWAGERSEAYTQLTPIAPGTELQYPPGVVPVGRFAEWDGEMMVDSVYAKRDDYVAALEGAARAWRAQ